ARYDDSVARVTAGHPMLVRRARGYAPASLPLPVPAPVPVLAVGAQLKATVTVAAGERAVLGPYVGDLENAATHGAYVQTIERLCDLHAVRPAVVAHDLHPGYLSTRYARSRPGVER